MNKDAILATAIGVILGITIFCAILFGPKITNKLPKIHWPTISFSLKLPNFGAKTQSKPNTQQPSAPTTLTISSPLAEALSDSNTLLVSGTAPANTTVVIGNAIDEAFVVTSANGTYAANITLFEGKNDITVTAVSKDSTLEQTVTVYYTPEKF